MLNSLMPAIEQKMSRRMMGNHFEISVVHPDAHFAQHAIELAFAEITRIEKLFTTFSEDSITNRLNAAAGLHEVQVPREFFNLVERAQKLSRLTDGLFDLSYGSAHKQFWNFDTSARSLPSEAEALLNVALVNYENIITNEKDHTIYLKQKGMRIGFGGIGKGYAADKARLVIQQQGIENGLVNASGDLTAWGNQSEEVQGWKVGVSNPSEPKLPLAWLQLKDAAIATSGNYEKFFVIDGTRYSHIINPKTGLPVTGIASVTILAPHAELADALATPVTIMGAARGIDFVNQLKGIECAMITDDHKIFTSKNINLHHPHEKN